MDAKSRRSACSNHMGHGRPRDLDSKASISLHHSVVGHFLSVYGRF